MTKLHALLLTAFILYTGCVEVKYKLPVSEKQIPAGHGMLLIACTVEGSTGGSFELQLGDGPKMRVKNHSVSQVYIKPGAYQLFLLSHSQVDGNENVYYTVEERTITRLMLMKSGSKGAGLPEYRISPITVTGLDDLAYEAGLQLIELGILK